jgi:hypothetical protein
MAAASGTKARILTPRIDRNPSNAVRVHYSVQAHRRYQSEDPESYGKADHAREKFEESPRSHKLRETRDGDEPEMLKESGDRDPGIPEKRSNL